MVGGKGAKGPFLLVWAGGMCAVRCEGETGAVWLWVRWVGLRAMLCELQRLYTVTVDMGRGLQCEWVCVLRLLVENMAHCIAAGQRQVLRGLPRAAFTCFLFPSDS